MKLIAKYIALVVLLVLITPPFLYLTEKMTIEMTKNVMLVATILWFITATFWMWEGKKQ